MIAFSTLPTVALGLVVLAGPSLAGPLPVDSITRTDGTVIEDVEIQTETLAEVSYKSDKSALSLPSEEVLEVRYEAYPAAIDEALAFLEDDDVLSAVQNLDRYVDGEIEKPSERRFKWAPGYAAWRAVELRMQLADASGAIAAAKRVIERFSDSRYVPHAYLAKAGAEFWTEKPDAARKTLDGLAALVSSGELSKRWDLECRLARLKFDGAAPGKAKRDAYAAIATEAGGAYPTVSGRAQVAQGESFLQEAEATLDTAAAQRLRDEARAVFAKVVENTGMDQATLAGAHTGLGDCLFYEGAAANDEGVLQRAAMHYLRVVTLYETQAHYVPKALYFSMRTFGLMNNRARRADMRRELLQRYPDSEWAQRPEVK